MTLQNLPTKPGEHAQTLALEAKESLTKPPARFTEATLLSAMEGAGKLVEDEELRAAMDQKGLGKYDLAAMKYAYAGKIEMFADDVKVPAVPNLELFAEFVRQGGRDDRSDDPAQVLAGADVVEAAGAGRHWPHEHRKNFGHRVNYCAEIHTTLDAEHWFRPWRHH